VISNDSRNAAASWPVANSPLPPAATT
jgi:hypothetical protein